MNVHIPDALLWMGAGALALVAAVYIVLPILGALTLAVFSWLYALGDRWDTWRAKRGRS